MVISLIGSLISESGRCKKTQRQSGRWNYYLNNLKTRRYSKLSKQVSCDWWTAGHVTTVITSDWSRRGWPSTRA